MAGDGMWGNITGADENGIFYGIRSTFKVAGSLIVRLVIGEI